MRRLKRGNPNTPEFWDDPARKMDTLQLFTDHEPNGMYLDLLFRPTERYINTLTDYVPSLIDVSAGSGYITRRFIDRYGRRIRYNACDFSRLAISWLSEKFPELDECFHCDLRQGIPKPDKSYDIVMSTEVIEHMDDPEGFVDELARVARRLILITCPFEEKNVRSDFHVWAFTYDDIWNLFSPHGDVEVNTDRGMEHFIVACRIDRGEFR